MSNHVGLGNDLAPAQKIRDRLFGHEALMSHLRAKSIPYVEIAHPAEGVTEAASRLRGHRLDEAAKSLVIEICLSGKDRRYVVAVVPGDRRVDLHAVSRAFGGRRAGFATPRRAEELTGCPMGAVTPFTFHPELDLVADPGLLDRDRLVFNAGRLDLSLVLTASDFFAAACPRVLPVALKESITLPTEY